MEDRPFMATQVTIEGTVSAIYDRPRYNEEAREWLQRWADKLNSLHRNNVVMLHAKPVSRLGARAGAADSGQHYLRAGDVNR
jgi:predicted NBD/HSP70 family sugar kinase